jgi:dienelactone hydrolase
MLRWLLCTACVHCIRAFDAMRGVGAMMLVLMVVVAAAAAAAALPIKPCGPPPKPPYPLVADLPVCSAFPDPWLRADNSRVASAADWSSHRPSMIRLLENYMYGHAPEQPPVRSTLTGTAEVAEYCERVNSRCQRPQLDHCKLRCVPLQHRQTLRNYTLRVGPSANNTWPFDVFVYTPKGAASPVPFVIYNGEGYYSGVEFGDLTAEGAQVLLDRGFGLALFDRNQLRSDHKTGGCADPGCGMGEPDGVQTLYPDNDWSTINVWAWGAAHVIDFLLSEETLAPLVDSKKLMSMGHSRGGKTALWHGAQDERVAITFPLMSGCSGNAAIRVTTPDGPNGSVPVGGDGRAQSVRDINRGFPYWFSKTYHNFSNAEFASSDASSRAPWDQHFQRALVAPRAQFGFEGIGNTHENPVGSQATFVAAREVYDWLQVPQKIGTFFHKCAHPMNDNTTRCDGSQEHDWRTCADFAQFIFEGKHPSNMSLFSTLPYPIQRPYAWKAPSTVV